MMDWTDRHCRYFHRLMSRRVLLYTEMITAAALVRGGARHLLDFSPTEHPVALQLGGSDPDELAAAARMGEGEGFDEINLNVGCPSDRVQSGCFGAVLMKSPDLVARCVRAMRAVVAVPVTVKCRIGVDDQDPGQVLPAFVATMREAGIVRMQIHARKAWLQGLSPKENREVPPLDPDLVHEVKRRFPEMHISINGGLQTLGEAEAHLAAGLDGAMIGRAAYGAPWEILGQADTRIWGETAPFSEPAEVARAMIPYIERHVASGGRAHSVTRHMLGLFTGRPGARAWRRSLSEDAGREDAGADVIETALYAMERRAA